MRTFFVISGFVITRLLILEERQTSAISLKNFYTRRFFRIVPVFYLMLFTVAVLIAFHIIFGTLASVLGASLFLADTNLMTHHWFTGHAWTLSVEEQFYLLFPLFFILSGARRRSRLLLLTLIALLAWSVLTQLGLFTQLFPPGAIIGFSCINLGALVALFEPEARRYAAGLHPLFAFLLAVFLFVHPIPPIPVALVLNALVTPFCIAIVLMYTVTHKDWASSILNNAAIQWIGLVSYSAYLWQQLSTGPIDFYCNRTAMRILHSPLFAILVITVSYYCVERPCTRFAKRRTTGSKDLKAVGTAVR